MTERQNRGINEKILLVQPLQGSEKYPDILAERASGSGWKYKYIDSYENIWQEERDVAPLEIDQEAINRVFEELDHLPDSLHEYDLLIEISLEVKNHLTSYTGADVHITDPRREPSTLEDYENWKEAAEWLGKSIDNTGDIKKKYPFSVNPPNTELNDELEIGKHLLTTKGIPDLVVIGDNKQNTPENYLMEVKSDSDSSLQKSQFNWATQWTDLPVYFVKVMHRREFKQNFHHG